MKNNSIMDSGINAEVPAKSRLEMDKRGLESEATESPKAEDDSPSHRIQIQRLAMNQDQFQDTYGYKGPSSPFKNPLDKLMAYCECSRSRMTSLILRRLPIFKWLPKYNLKTDLINDLVAGFTVGIMHIPQGMAYGILAGCLPITGIYTAFFPILIYIILGTSPHVSMGTFAVVSIIISSSVNDLSSSNDCSNLANGEYCTTQVATVITFLVGIILFIFGIFQLGCFTNFLSKPLVSGFTTGSSLHVLTSQVKHLLGLQIKRPTGYFTIIKTYKEIFLNITLSNPVAIGISLACMGIFIFYDEFIKARLVKIFRYPFPLQLIVVILGTTISHFMDLSTTANVNIIGNIPVGIPFPTLPPLELIPKVFSVSLSCAMVSYAISMSLSKIFAQKHSYEVDASQELYAMGLANIFGSFFSSLPMSASLSRSLVQDNSGCKTLLTSGVSAFLLLWVLLYLAPLFVSLPTAVLAAIILVSLKGLLLQSREILVIWKMSYVDGIIWIATFLTTVIVDVGVGLLVGIGVSLLGLLRDTIVPRIQIVQPANDSLDIFISPKEYEILKEDESFWLKGTNALYIRISGNLSFANCETSVGKIIELIQADDNNFSNVNRTLMIDFSSVNSMDPSACKAIINLYLKLDEMYWKISFVGVKNTVWNQLLKCEVLSDIPIENFYPTMHDAVSYSSRLASKL